MRKYLGQLLCRLNIHHPQWTLMVCEGRKGWTKVYTCCSTPLPEDQQDN